MTPRLTAEELDEIERRCQAARPGPWTSHVEGRDFGGGSNFIMVGEQFAPDRGEDIELCGATIADQDFMASARQDVVRLVAEVRRLRSLLRE